MNVNTLDNACHLFTDRLIGFMKDSVPNKEVLIRPSDKPWYDTEIRKCSRVRDHLKKKAAKSKSNTDWAKYKKIRNKVNNLKKTTLKNLFIITLKITLSRQRLKILSIIGNL